MSQNLRVELQTQQGALAQHIRGSAIGDAIGLPYEGLSTELASRLVSRFKLRYWMWPNFGVGSDDTDHALMTYLALLHSNGSIDTFSKNQAALFRVWFLSFPPGIGLTTLKACIKLCLGSAPNKSGFSSEGNGPLMRAGILAYSDYSAEKSIGLLQASTIITHKGHKAYLGSRIVFLLNRWAIENSSLPPIEYLKEKLQASGTNLPEYFDALQTLTIDEFHRAALLRELDCPNGVTGWINHTLPAVVYCLSFSTGHFQADISRCISLGGDVDTTTSIFTGVWITKYGQKSIPEYYLTCLKDPTLLLLRPAGKLSFNQTLIAFYFLCLVKTLIQAPLVVAMGFSRLLLRPISAFF